MRYNGQYNAINHPLIKLSIVLSPSNRTKIEGMFRALLKKRFLKLVNSSYIKQASQMDELIVSVNRRWRKEFEQATINILTEMGCSDFVIERSKYSTLVACETPFGPRRIECLSFGFDGSMERVWESATIGIRLIGFNFPSVLDFKGTKGGLENVISDDYVEHYELIKKELYAISKEFEILEIKFVDGRN